MRDAGSGDYEKRDQHQERKRLDPQQPAAWRMPGYRIVAHPLAKKGEISSAGIPPSRIMRQPPPSAGRSTVGGATTRGGGAPVGKRPLRPRRWSRTCAALGTARGPRYV